MTTNTEAQNILRECCDRCMWYGPVNRNGTMRKHRSAIATDRYGRQVQDMTADVCPGSHRPFARFGGKSEQVADATYPDESQMSATVEGAIKWLGRLDDLDNRLDEINRRWKRLTGETMTATDVYTEWTDIHGDNHPDVTDPAAVIDSIDDHLQAGEDPDDIDVTGIVTQYM